MCNRMKSKCREFHAQFTLKQATDQQNSVKLLFNFIYCIVLFIFYLILTRLGALHALMCTTRDVMKRLTLH